MIPHTPVLEPGLRVYKVYNGYWFFGRPTVEELRLDLRAVIAAHARARVTLNEQHSQVRAL
jgi:hypothetical protein